MTMPKCVLKIVVGESMIKRQKKGVYYGLRWSRKAFFFSLSKVT